MFTNSGLCKYLNPITYLQFLVNIPIKIRKLLKIPEMRSFIGSCLIFFSMGLKYMLGAVYLYIVSYFRQFDKSITIQDTQVQGNSNLISGIFSFISIQIAVRIGFTRLVKFSSIIDVFCFFICTFIHTKYSLQFFYVMIPMFLAFGICYMPIVDNIWNSNFQNKGQMTGILFGILGLGQIFYVYFLTLIINPENVQPSIEVQNQNQTFKYYDEDVTKNVPHATMIVAVINLLTSVLGSCLLVPQKQKNDEQQEDKKKLFECLKSRYFLTIYSTCQLIYLGNAFININFKPYLQEILNNDYQIATLASVFSFFTIIGRLLGGYLYERVPIITLLQIQLFFSMFAHILFYSLEDFGSLCIGTILFGLSDGGSMVVIATSLTKVFGQSMAGKVYACKGVAILVANFLVGYNEAKWIDGGGTLKSGYFVCILLGIIGWVISLSLEQKFNQKGKQDQDKVEMAVFQFQDSLTIDSNIEKQEDLSFNKNV